MSQIPIIINNFSEKAIDNLAILTEEVIFFPNQVIYSESDSKDASLMFIAQGSGNKKHIQVYACCSVIIFVDGQQTPNWIVEIIQARSDSKSNRSSVKSLSRWEKNSVFGEMSFFTGLARESSAKALDFTKVIKIHREKFIEVIRGIEKDFETFHAIKDKILLYSNYADINRACTICTHKSHLESECPFIHPNKSPWIVKSLFEKSMD